MHVWLMMSSTAGVILAGAWGVAKSIRTGLGDVDRLQTLRVDVERRKEARLERMRELAARNPLMKQPPTPTA